MMRLDYKVRPDLDKFEEKFMPEPNTGCWLWIAGNSQGRYGKFSTRINGKREYRAHRVSFLLYRGAIPPNLHVLHKCDMRDCVNPDHLYVGTNRDNMDDRNKRCRNIGRPRKNHSK